MGIEREEQAVVNECRFEPSFARCAECHVETDEPGTCEDYALCWKCRRELTETTELTGESPGVYGQYDGTDKLRRNQDRALLRMLEERALDLLLEAAVRDSRDGSSRGRGLESALELQRALSDLSPYTMPTVNEEGYVMTEEEIEADAREDDDGL